MVIASSNFQAFIITNARRRKTERLIMEIVKMQFVSKCGVLFIDWTKESKTKRNKPRIHVIFKERKKKDLQKTLSRKLNSNISFYFLNNQIQKVDSYLNFGKLPFIQHLKKSKARRCFKQHKHFISPEKET